MKRKGLALDVPHKKQCPSKSALEGEILTDLKDKKWKIGSSIGIGGFGEIYLASDDISKPVPVHSDFVVKVEPFMSGPLFVEIHVYAKIGKEELINQYVINRKMKFLGMPHFLGCGSHFFNNERYRFIVLPKYGIDLQTVFLNSGKQFSTKTAFTLATYVIDVLEYIHSNGYVHADIKASNLVLDKENRTPVYLLDYGLSCKFYDDVGNHKKLESDQRKAHNGTLVFTSRDAHFGAHSRRGDLEVLGYNLIQWITGSLPWEGNTDAEMIADYKTKMMSNLSLFLEECFGQKNILIPDALIQYLKYVNKLKFKSKPDYQYCRKLFRQAVRDAGCTFNGDLSLNVNWLRVPKKRHKCNSDRENNGKYERQKPCAIPVNVRKPCAVRNFNPRLTRKSTHSTVQFDWPKILAGHPEKPSGVLSMYDIPSEPLCGISACSDSSDSTTSETLYTRGLDNPTLHMKLILEKEKHKEKLTSYSNLCINPTVPFPVASKMKRCKKSAPLAVVTACGKVNSGTKNKSTKKEHGRLTTSKQNTRNVVTSKEKTSESDSRKKVSFGKIAKSTITKLSVSKNVNRNAKKKCLTSHLYVKDFIRSCRNTHRWTNLTRSSTRQKSYIS